MRLLRPSLFATKSEGLAMTLPPTEGGVNTKSPPCTSEGHLLRVKHARQCNRYRKLRQEHIRRLEGTKAPGVVHGNASNHKPIEVGQLDLEVRSTRTRNAIGR